MNYDTVAAISTAQGEGGIGVIRISGDDALRIADKIFNSVSGKKVTEMKGYTASFGKISENGEDIDEAVALVFKAPHSYTGEDVVELSCHGGLYITKRVLRAVLNAGAVPAQAGEFTKRAFLNGKIDLTEAEAVIDIISAKSRGAARSALCVKEGALRKKIDGVKNDLLSMAAHLSAWADYPEEDIAEVTADSVIETCDKAIKCFKSLLDSYDCGQAVKKGIDTVIAGRPNVGKSTLMNLLSGYEKSIVPDIPGTSSPPSGFWRKSGGMTMRRRSTWSGSTSPICEKSSPRCMGTFRSRPGGTRGITWRRPYDPETPDQAGGGGHALSAGGADGDFRGDSPDQLSGNCL